MTRLKVAAAVMALMLVFAGCAGSSGGGEQPTNESEATSGGDMGGDMTTSEDGGMGEDSDTGEDTEMTENMSETTDSMNGTTESMNASTSTNSTA